MECWSSAPIWNCTPRRRMRVNIRTQVCLSRRDQMMVARHGMHGTCPPETRPVGYGMIGWREGAIVADSGPSVAPQITPFSTGRIMPTHYQAFHAWLPSFHPSGTKVSFLMLT